MVYPVRNRLLLSISPPFQYQKVLNLITNQLKCQESTKRVFDKHIANLYNKKRMVEM